MSDLRNAIVAWIDWRSPGDGALDALRTVVDLHAPATRLGAEDNCVGCQIEGVAFRYVEKCPTLLAIGRALDLS